MLPLNQTMFMYDFNFYTKSMYYIPYVDLSLSRSHYFPVSLPFCLFSSLFTTLYLEIRVDATSRRFPNIIFHDDDNNEEREKNTQEK